MLDIGHPKDVNLFKNVMLRLQEKGHEIQIFARAKENTKKMLAEYGFEYKLSKHYRSMSGKALGILVNDVLLYKYAREFNPDIFVSPGSPYSAHVSRLIGKPHIAFSDTEIAGIVTKLTLPFTDKIYTSTSFYLDLGIKQERFNGYCELAYLHPRYFTPKKEVTEKYQLKESYIILRLSALASNHDLHATGFGFKTEEELKEYLYEIEKFGQIIIFSETSHWQTIKDYQIEIDSRDLHDLLYYSRLYIGEGASMASEAAILGVPSIYVSNTERGYLNELEQKYGLVYNIEEKDEGLKRAIEILKDESLRDQWHLKRDKMLSEKIDVVEYIVDVIENAA
jgi:predicted glycosyltransferase